VSSAAEDELAVRNLIAKVARRADGDDVDAYVELFTPDARWEMPGATRIGHDDIRAGSIARRESGQIGPGAASRHVVTTIVVTLDGDTADAESTFQFFVDTTTTPTLSMIGTYQDHFVRTDAGWKLARRTIGQG
jgi:3-phenylpropionate/cinnamic acid dioxygenase small subunit